MTVSREQAGGEVELTSLSDPNRQPRSGQPFNEAIALVGNMLSSSS
jgi:hypothetical protein